MTAEAATGARPELGMATGMPRVWLRIEGIAALAAGVALYLSNGGELLALVPLILAVDISMVGYLRGPRLGSVVYNLMHNWAIGLAFLGAGFWFDSLPGILAGSILVAHVGMDRIAGYGLKYPTDFKDTHLGRLGR